MDDLISRSALKADLIESKDELWKIYRSITHDVDKQICAGQIASFQEVILRVKDAPAVDAVEVVRCKDCKHYHDFETHFDCNHGCGMDYVQPTDFCSCGERRADDGDQ